ncbi:hypothetical protein EX895_002060 [Sporisorium graminicola]|uniref:ELMO domain-containing protein n=1 Tax=Sporisorium graminicola TaxID=280036 RepID=A0A4V6EU19_9BASI|nr:hypothetical protein EX895_002060 [Sporisorium graminicola]TKY88819.1 hypothetical protein EX895_002060 [Sporisorium graminicola]
MSGAEPGPSRSGLPNVALATTTQQSYIDPVTPQLASPQIANRINLVTYGQSTIKALIDPSLPVQDVIRQLCANAHLGVQEPPALFALRDDDDDELIDDANMARKIEAGANFKLCSSPTIEAVEMVDKLSSRDDRTLKMATYTLQRLIKEPAFTDEFVARGGVRELLNVIRNHSSGNTLAYALTSCQNLMEGFEYGWDIIDAAFVAKVVTLLVTQERINVCRPATAILKKLVVSGPQDSPKTGRVVTDGGHVATTSTPAVYRYGFEFVYNEIQRERLFLQTLVNRIGSSDTTLKLYSLSLINSLLRNVSDDLFEGFTSELEKLNASKAVAWLMDSSRGDELASSILEYQSNVIRAAHRRMRSVVTPTDKRHVHALSYIWLQAKISDVVVPNQAAPHTGSSNNDSRLSVGSSTRYKWRRIGFASESAAKEFGRTGWLGLSCLESFVRSDPETYSKIILEQINRPEERRCMLARASIEVTSILADHWNIESGSYTTSTTYLPFLLSFSKVHHLALRFFLRMWNESGAAASDFARVSALVRSQVNEALGKQDETSSTWSELEDAFLNSEYRTVRDRQMKELEVDEDYNSKASMRNLRGRIYRESYEFVRQQRIQCLLEGAWFRNVTSPAASALGNNSKQRRISTSTVDTAVPAARPTGNGAASGTPKPWRFYRLAPNKKFLYYCDSSERFPIRGGLDDLAERIDLSLVTEVSHHSGAGDTAAGGAKKPTGELVISLLQSPDASLAEMQALNASQFSEWTDGLTMLRSEGGVVSTRETADLIQTLTEIGIKVKLLDLTGEQIELPTTVQPPPLPSTTEFFFAEL